MEFIQIIDYETTQPEAVQALGERFRKEQEGVPGGPSRVMWLHDRDNPDRYVTLLEFPSYEEAMANSGRPEVQEFAARMTELCSREPVFSNCDLRERMER
ncbi:hypothetical protein SRB5_25480 [Streptomyces sp. RB5]|uniref:Antibiotic biosynthesis monooxygenase n=1 Tax=Streptomyces smaragdinus TaxID=2585196 RepID=A0A7K0CG12_9ACTN|nr:hypothetical protein [Streptomyces smaragdinus]MQY12415.1 hypothetical protein [Streptomyces smaragdinus]